MNQEHEVEYSGEIAVIGMACRFPGADDLDAFWLNLRSGAHGVTFFADQEAAGLAHVTPAEGQAVVKARGLLRDIDAFDAEFFGLNAQDALLMDPQQRLLFETAQHALDHAGCNPAQEGHAMGVFTGVGAGSYGQRLREDPTIAAAGGGLQIEIGNEKDYSAPRLAYLLNLRGPSLPIQTACSTSLVAVHAACQSLMSRECDSALAGGSCIPYLEPVGYLYQQDGIYSPDGHCRAFDEAAAGTTPGSGVGLVVLKRLEDAQAAADRILAVIAATAVNNDGAEKVGFTAPGVCGQRDVIEEAIALADLDPQHIGYIETHGTGTNLGDPIEIEALRQVFGPLPQGRVALGAVKTNIGHAGAAAGIAGLIKAVLCRHHNTLVPTLHFKRPNPKLGLEDSPFYVNTDLAPWPEDQPYAGVSSFGIGGANCHLILGPAPAVSQSPRAKDRTSHLLTLSARNRDALARHAENLAAHLEDAHAPSLSDAAFSLNTGRDAYEFRAHACAADPAEAARLLRDAALTAANAGPAGAPAVIFNFTGQGVAVKDWGGALYREERVFREAADRAGAALQPHLGLDLTALMFGPDPDLKAPDLHQPALFLLGYALAATWTALGVQPASMLGHSVGEFAAAVVAEVLSLEDAAALIALRGKLTRALPTGAMVALPIPEAEASAYLNDDIALAAVNGPRLCVFSGEHAAVDALIEKAQTQNVQPIRLPATHAFHSAMMRPALEPLTQAAGRIRLSPPKIPLLSGVTGTWLSDTDAVDPGYWARHMLGTVRYHDCLQAAAQLEDAFFLELGPGNALTRLVARMDSPPQALATLEPQQDGARAFRNAVGALWCAGVAVDWELWFEDQDVRKTALPGYPFQRRSYWVAPTEAAAQRARLETRRAENDWFYRPVWQQHAETALDETAPVQDDGVWLLFSDQGAFAKALVDHLQGLNQTVVQVRPGRRCHEQDGVFEINPARAEDYHALVNDLAQTHRLPRRVIHAWTPTHTAPLTAAELSPGLDLGFSSILRLAQALDTQTVEDVQLCAVTSGALTVGRGQDALSTAWAASIQGAVQVAPLEYDFLSCCHHDLDLDQSDAVATLLSRFTGSWDERTRVSAHGLTWRLAHEAVTPPTPTVDQAPIDGGVVLIVNAFQQAGYALCRRLQARGVKVVLLDRAFLPERAEWDAWVAQHGASDWTAQVITRLKAIGERLFVKTANPTDARAMAALVDQLKHEHGGLNGVFLLDHPGDTGLIQTKAPANPAPVLAEKMAEALTLVETVADLDRLVIFSANRDEAGGLGQSEQAAAGAFLEAFAAAVPPHIARRTQLIQWGPIQTQGDADDHGLIGGQLAEKRRRFGLSPAQQLDAADRLLLTSWNNTVVSTRDYNAVLAQQQQFTAAFFKQQASNGAITERPELTTAYRPAQSDVETLLVEVWEEGFALKPIGVDDDFFELGGHSLLAVDLLAGIGRVFSVAVTLEDLFANPTIAQLAVLLSGDQVEVAQADLMEDLLGQIEGLSPEEVEAMLAAVETEAGLTN